MPDPKPSAEALAVEAAAVLEAVMAVLNGEVVSDFMLSFSVVRAVDDLVRDRMGAPPPQEPT